MARVGYTTRLVGNRILGNITAYRMVVGFKEGFSLVFMDSLFDHGRQSVDWNTDNSGEPHWTVTSSHPGGSHAYCTLAFGGAMDGYTNVVNSVCMGMGIIIF